MMFKSVAQHLICGISAKNKKEDTQGIGEDMDNMKTRINNNDIRNMPVDGNSSISLCISTSGVGHIPE